MKIKGLLQNVVLAVVSVTVFFLIAEFSVRLIKVHVNQTGGYLNFGCYHWAADQYVVPIQTRDDYLFWRCNEEDGDFGERKYELEKGENTYRVLCLGDSTTQGYVLPPYKFTPTTAYPRFLEEVLNKNSRGIHFEVMNAGCGGYSSFQGLRFLEKTLLAYHPDLIIAGFGINDASPAMTYSDKEQQPVSVPVQKVRAFLEKSHFVLVLRSAIFSGLSKLQELREDEKMRVSGLDFEKNLKDIALLAKEKNAAVVFLKLPTTARSGRIEAFSRNAGKEDYEQVFDRLQKQGFLVIDLAAGFNRIPDGAKHFLDMCHTDPEGNKITAEEIYGELLEKKMVPPEVLAQGQG